MLVAGHCNGLPELAAGMKALPDTAASFAHTQALWRFLDNERVTPVHLGAPLVAGAREGIAENCVAYALVAHDWSRLNYNSHPSKQDRLTMTHATDVGYELQSSLVIGDKEGAPLSPVAQNLVTSEKMLSTYRPPAAVTPAGAIPAESAPAEGGPAAASPPYKAPTHLDELTERMAWLEAQNLGKPLVHIIDREADSVDHLRQWTAAKQRWLIRAKAGSKVRVGDKNHRLDAVAAGLRYRSVRQIDLNGKPCQQWVADTLVVLARPARSKRKDAAGKRVKPKPGAPIEVRLVVSRIEDAAGKLVAMWYLLCHLQEPVDAAEVVLWYYFRWRIESFFKLLKQAGHQLEHWGQESGTAIFKRLLIASQACVLTWRILHAQGPFAVEAQRFLVRLSGRQTKRTQPITAPAILSGLHTLFSMMELLQHYSPDQIKAYARFAFPDRYPP